MYLVIDFYLYVSSYDKIIIKISARIFELNLQ